MARNELDPNALGGGFFTSKFLRVGNNIYTSPPDDLNTEHDQLAKSLGILGQITLLLAQKSLGFDAGIVTFSPPDMFMFNSRSYGLKWPDGSTMTEVRSETVHTAQMLFPGYEVVSV